MDDCCAVVDLRQYTLHPGQRDTLIDVFDQYFVEGQEATGMHIAGQFRDLDDPDRFVWIRGFTDLPARAEALNAFYYGPIWREHAATANATMIDSDNALLLKPVHLGAGYPRLDSPRPPRGTTESPRSVVAGAVYHRDSTDDGFVEYFTERLLPALPEPVAVFESLVAENNFPALPLRDEVVLAWFARFDDDAAYDAFRGKLAAFPAGEPVQELRLRPSARSQLR